MAHGEPELLEELLSWLDGLCATCLSIQQAQCPEAFQGRGVVVPESQVTLALSGQIPVEPCPGFAGHLAGLRERWARSEEPLADLLCRLACTGPEALALLLALAPEVNRKYERVFAFLQDDARERRATLGLLADLWALVEPVEEGALFGLCDEERLLNRCVLEPGPPGLSRPLALRESALLYLTGAAHLPAVLAGVGELLDPGGAQEPLANAALARRAARFAGRCLEEEGGPTGLLQICGGPGTGRRFVLAYVAGAVGRPVLLLDCRRLAALEAGERRRCAGAALSWCFLNRAVPALRYFDLEALSPADRTAAEGALLDAFRGGVPLLAVCARHPMKTLPDGFRPLLISIPAPTLGQQRRYWQAFAERGALPLAEGVDPRQLAGVYALSPGQIRSVLALAGTECVARGEAAVDRSSLALGVRLLCSPELEELAEPLAPAFTWDDLVLGEDAMEKLRGLCRRVRCRWQVNEGWGFDRKLPYGRGISVCLYGPPGTGKTMTAQVLSQELGLDAYRVDMSRIMDKYIGETEKKLSALFDAARDSNAILFFDEADALFAKRTEVGDSKDRYANVETAYLLQRMESHNGISILATNAVQNFDEAFKRRISLMVHLPMPDLETRRRLWEKVFPPEAPLEGVRLDFFAERFELTGSAIKNVALAAAYLAAAEGGSITRAHLVQAVREEYRKTGRVLMEHELY